MRSFKTYITEGGNVFAGKTASIKLEYIKPTLDAYYAELKKLFPKKASIFNDKHFHPLGSVGKKPLSGDIDLGIDSKDILDSNMSDKSIEAWNIDPKKVHAEFAKLEKRAKTSSPEQLMFKAFLKELTLYINAHAPNLFCDEKKVTAGNIFGLFPQITPKGEHVGIGVQIDWMVGNLQWLTFSYHSSAYPADSNVKGLHRTQLMLSAFQTAGLSFNHVSGVKDRDTGEVIATTPEAALGELNARLGTKLTTQNVADYYLLHDQLKKHLKPKQYSDTVDTYFKILDSTRADIPDDLQAEWKKRKAHLGLTGKYLPDNSALKESTMNESSDYKIKVAHTGEDGKEVSTEYTIRNAKDDRHARNIAMQKHSNALKAKGIKYTRMSTSAWSADGKTGTQKIATNESIEVHRIGVTVSEPDHTNVTQRKQKVLRTAKVTAGSKEEAMAKAKAHYKKMGYKVHDVNHIQQVA